MHQIDTLMLSALIENSDDAIISTTIDGRITSWNSSAINIFGYTTDEVVGKNITLIFPPNLHREYLNVLEIVSTGKKKEVIEAFGLTKSGDQILISLKISPVKDAEGSTSGISHIIRDITEQKISEEKQAKLAAIVSSSDDAIISKTLEGIITSWNQSAQRMFGYTESEAIGKHISILIPKERMEEERIIIGKIQKGEKIDHYETIRVSKYGKEIPISLTVSPIKDRFGNITGASKIARDITEQLESRKRLNSYNKQLELANLYKDEFIGMASHELKTPLTSIYGYLQLLERTLKEDMSRDLARKTIRQVIKLNGLVSDLLDVSKIQAGKLQLNCKPFYLKELLIESMDMAQQISGSHKMELVFEKDDILITADKQRLEQVLTNLLSNAVKYSPHSNRVILTVENDDNTVKVSVQDFGIGIPLSQQKKIFSRFYRVEGLEPVYSGLGIGLYISREIIHMHHGELWVESKEGEGSIFSFRIPAAYSNV